MIDLMAVYICPEHGEVLEDQVHTIEEVDIENDEVYVHKIHDLCGKDVTAKVVDGVQEFAQVDHERWLWATGFYDDPPGTCSLGYDMDV